MIPSPPSFVARWLFMTFCLETQSVIDDIGASLAEDAMALLNSIRSGAGVIVTPLQPSDLIALRTPDVLVDARMQKYRTIPDLRHIAPLTIGLGQVFRRRANCDLAVETQPARSGRLIKRGALSAPADHTPNDWAASAKQHPLRVSREGSGTPRSRSAAAFSRVLSLAASTDRRRARRSTESCADWFAMGRQSRRELKCWRSTRAVAARGGPVRTIDQGRSLSPLPTRLKTIARSAKTKRRVIRLSRLRHETCFHAVGFRLCTGLAGSIRDRAPANFDRRLTI